MKAIPMNNEDNLVCPFAIPQHCITSQCLAFEPLLLTVPEEQTDEEGDTEVIDVVCPSTHGHCRRLPR